MLHCRYISVRQWYLDKQDREIAVGDTVDIKGLETASREVKIHVHCGEVKKGARSETSR